MQLNLEIEKLREKKIFLATPCYGGQCHGLYLKSCLDLQSLLGQNGIPIQFSFLFNESLITRARNYLVDEFLRSDATHLLFIDSDIHFQPMDVLALLALDKDIIGAPYPKKSISWKQVVRAIGNMTEEDRNKLDVNQLSQVIGEYVFNPVPGTQQFDVREPLEVLEIGTGFMMVKREVFEKFKEEYPHLRYKPDHVGQQNFDGSRYIHAFFDTVIDPVSDRYLSEDYMFCQAWREIGGQIWMCPWMKTGHVGTYEFIGNMPAIAQMTAML